MSFITIKITVDILASSVIFASHPIADPTHTPAEVVRVTARFTVKPLFYVFSQIDQTKLYVKEAGHS